jgi:ATP-dependent Clp protease adaptor protein ClpS
MSEEKGVKPDAVDADESAGTVVAEPKKSTRGSTATKKTPSLLPPWNVLLHNDDKNEMLFVIRAIVELTPLNREDAMQRMFEAHKSGVALLLTTHKERAELYLDQFQTKGLTISIEPQK